MANFKVGDRVRLKPGVYRSHTDFDSDALCWPGSDPLPEDWEYKEVYIVAHTTGTTVEIDAISYGSWVVKPDAIELINDLTKAERFTKSKHRVETRHLRKKVCQQKIEPVLGAKLRATTVQEITSFNSPTIPAGTVLDADTLSQWLEIARQIDGIPRPSYSLDYILSR